MNTAKAGARGVRDVALFHYPSRRLNQTQFSYNFADVNASEGSPFLQIFILLEFNGSNINKKEGERREIHLSTSHLT
jgi:hypothetical protein